MTEHPDRAGWLGWPDYLAAIEADGTRLVDAAAAAPAAAVPSCPGWTAGDLLEHVTYVYRHKIACMRDGAAPDPWPPEGVAIDDRPYAFRTALADLLAELVRRDPDERRYTWWPADQTNGFWYRRMALETAIHRVDAELANAAVTAIPDPLALDGIDEMLCIMLAGEDWRAVRTEHPIDATLDIAAGDRSWSVRATGERVLVARQRSTADTTISGTPHDVFVWLWGRGPVDPLRVCGDPAHAARLRARLVEAD